jgi:predicted nucleic acid-binding protein
LLSIFEDILLDIALLVKNTQLIVFINQLNTHVISRLTGHLVIENQVVHFFLQRVNNQVKFISLIDFLADNAHFVLVSEFLVIQDASKFISFLILHLDLLFALSQYSVFVTRFVFENLDFVLKNLNSLLHFGQILT